MSALHLRLHRPPRRVGRTLCLGLLLLGAPALGETQDRAAPSAARPLFQETPRRRAPPPAKGTAVTQHTFVQLASRAGPAVVHLTVTRRHAPAGDNPRRGGRELGTGFIINRDGYLLTNNHVVAEADEIRVRLHDERDFAGRVIGRDERTDLALVKIEPMGSPLEPALLGDSDELQIGEWVVAIGNPFGLDHTVTAGIVSAKGRREVQPGGHNGFFDFIQTDASINPGNSGGPLLNTRGEVIGINTAINVAGTGIGFAIPINLAKVIAGKLHQNGKVVRSWLGVYPQPIAEGLRRAFGLADRRGALIAEVVSGSPAQEAGLLPGDVILEFDGKPVQRADDLVWLVSVTDPRPVALSVVRDGKRRRVELSLVEAGGEDPPPPPRRPPSPSSLGITVVEMSPLLARQIGYDEGRGVVVMQVEPESPAMEAGVERGDVILQINGKAVVHLQAYAALMREVQKGAVIRLLVRREEHKVWRNRWVAFVKR